MLYLNIVIVILYVNNVNNNAFTNIILMTFYRFMLMILSDQKLVKLIHLRG